MHRKPINEVLSDNLAFFMSESSFKTQAALAAKSGVAQRTIGNYLKPALRGGSASGKAPSAKLSELESIARALHVEVWELLRPMSAADRVIYRKVEEAFDAIKALTTSEERDLAVPLHEPRKRFSA